MSSSNNNNSNNNNNNSNNVPQENYPGERALRVGS